MPSEAMNRFVPRLGGEYADAEKAIPVSPRNSQAGGILPRTHLTDADRRRAT